MSTHSKDLATVKQQLPDLVVFKAHQIQTSCTYSTTQTPDQSQITIVFDHLSADTQQNTDIAVTTATIQLEATATAQVRIDLRGDTHMTLGQTQLCVLSGSKRYYVRSTKSKPIFKSMIIPISPTQPVQLIILLAAQVASGNDVSLLQIDSLEATIV